MAATAISGSISTASPPATPTCAIEGAARRLLRNLLRVYDENDLRGHPRPHRGTGALFPHDLSGQEGSGRRAAAQGHVPRMGGRVPVGLFRLAVVEHPPPAAGLLHGRHFLAARRPSNATCCPSSSCWKRRSPTLISVALDPEASGPDTHYKVLQAINEATQQYARTSGGAPVLRVARSGVGYRNVWYRFHPAEANLYVPVSLNMFSVMESAFMNTFVSQREASFPSHEYDGPFCHWPEDPSPAVPGHQDLPGPRVVCRASQPADPCGDGLGFPPRDGLEEFSHTARNCARRPKRCSGGCSNGLNASYPHLTGRIPKALR